MTNSSQNFPLVEEEAPLQKHVKALERKRNMVMGPDGTRNPGEDHHQFTRPIQLTD
jgi:1-acyl-sn-glycerol-3-phosphate acyltransferase